MKIEDKIIESIREEAKGFFVGASGCHDWSHVERVHDLAVRLARKEKADIGIVRIAAYLHDIGRREEMRSKGKLDHAEEGVKLARKILARYDIKKETKENILHCILAHRFRNDHRPETIEAKVLFDADKLDSIGAIGVARDFLFAGTAGSCSLYTGNEKKLVKDARSFSYTEEDSALLEYYFKLKKVKSKIITQAGKEIARERHDFMVEFFKRFEKEIRGLL
jgi:uncharacterized protein